MALLVSRQTQKLTLPTTLPGVTQGDWVEILTSYNSDMRRRIMRRTMTIKMAGAAMQDSSFDLDPFASRQAVVEEIVTAWSEPIPVSPEAIGEMHPSVQDWIAEQFDAIASGRSADEKKRSGESSESPPPPLSLVSSPASSSTS